MRSRCWLTTAKTTTIAKLSNNLVVFAFILLLLSGGTNVVVVLPFENSKLTPNRKPRNQQQRIMTSSSSSSPLQVLPQHLESRGDTTTTNTTTTSTDDKNYHHVEIPSVFGEIIRGEESATILDDSSPTLLAFRDRKPRAPLHGLIVPRQKWIPNVFHLNHNDVELLEEMYEMGLNLVDEYYPDARTNNDFLLCFHVPPFYSVDHLHLHVLAPASQISRLGQIKYKVDSRWCISFQTVLQRLRIGASSAVPFQKWDFLTPVLGTCVVIAAVPTILISVKN